MKNHALNHLPKGVWTALATPFTENSNIDFSAFKILVQRQIDAGIHALVPCGTTGESATLSDDEKIELTKICVELAQGRVPVIAGAGHNDTSKAVFLHKKMKEAGAKATLQVTPYYNKPTQEGLYRHFRAIADSCDLPVVMYNVASRTSVDMLPTTVLRLAKDASNIVAIKETTTDTVRMQNFISDMKAVRPEFLMLSGEDGFMLPFLAMGGDGLVSVGSNFAPDLFCSVFEAAVDGQLETARAEFAKIAKLTPLMFACTNPLPVKTALSFLGFIKNHYRLPLCPMSNEETAQLKSALTAQGWL